MSFKIEIQEVVITEAGNGPRKYKVADVVYSWNGNQRKQRVMSFANPDVFKTVSAITNPVAAEIEVTKNAKGYDEWAKVSLVNASSGSTTAAKATAPGKVLGSNYETPEERKFRQLLIVRQSSIANAIEMFKGTDLLTVEHVLEVAQEFVDFVYGTNETLETLDRMPNDIPEQ